MTIYFVLTCCLRTLNLTSKKKNLANKIKIVGRQLKTCLLPKMESYDLLDLYQYVLPVYCSCPQVIHLYLNYYKLDM